MEYINPSEAVILNPILQSRPVMIALDINKPVYAATQNGIYLVKKGQYMKNEGYKVFLVSFSAIFSLLFMIAGLSALTDPAGRTIGIVLLVMAIGGLYYSWKTWRSLKEGQSRNTLPVELVIPWSQVRDVMVVNVRDINTGTLLNPIIREVGDWHIFTTDGREIVIPGVNDPYNKLDYVKNRFGLKF